MALSEIEKLERRYAENPHGLTFAPLAEVYRKNGDLQRALELLKPGLQNHPDYIPASIVLGRCHLDLGDLPAAETAFTHVLGLDGENVIALKALADINERLHRFDDAERWLNTLLSLDRSNDEARSQLARLELARRQTEVGAAAPAAESASAGPDSDAGGAVSGDAATAAKEPAGPELAGIEAPAAAWVPGPDAPSAAEATPLMLEDLEPSPLEDLELPPAGLERDDPVSDEEPVEPMSDLVGREVDLPEPADEFRVETSEEIVLESVGGGEFQVPDASQELFSRGADPSPFAEMVPSPAPAPAAEPEPARHEEPLLEGEPVAAAGDDSSGLAFAPLLIEAAGMVPPREEAEEEPGEERPAAEPEWVAPPSAEPVAGAEAEAPTWQAPFEPVDLPGAGATERVLETPGLAPEPFLPEPSAPEPSAPEPVTAAAAPEASEPAPVMAPAAPAEPAAPVEPLPAFAPPQPEPVVTETMAEVLLQQGHAAEALMVYRALASRSGDPRLHQRVAALESSPSPAPRPLPYSAAETGGRSVGDTLRAILAARPPARSAAPPVRQADASGAEGAPTRPAAEALSLSSVFGEETPAAPPAVPAAPPERERVSFDDFYGGAGPSQAQRGPRATEPKSDDLDEFHAWLQNLKR
jgi:hypothetical protein